MFMAFIRAANGFFWGSVVLWILLGTGLFFTIRLALPQVRHFGQMFRHMKNSLKRQEEGVSSFGALCTAIGGQVGTGNLAGVATAIASGGPGAIFWMWITAILGMPLIFAEAILGQLFRVKNNDGTYSGGPAFYMEKGLGQKWMSVLFSIAIIVGVGFIITMVQANSIAAGFRGVSSVKELYVGLGLLAVSGMVVFGGIKRISNVAKVVVPVMALIYLVVALFLVLTHLSEIPAVFTLIFKSAFSGKAVAGGILGHTVRQAFRFGVARGLFSNEAGQGTTPNVHAAANAKHPAGQGMAAMMGVFIDTLVICTATAVIILLSGSLESGKTGIELTQLAMKASLGSFGPMFIFLAILFFAWTSLLADIYYGEVNIQYLFPGNQTVVTIYRVIACAVIPIGAMVAVPTVWELADFCNALMIPLNLVALLALSGLVVKVMKDYESQLAAGIDVPVWDYNTTVEQVRSGQFGSAIAEKTSK